MTKQTNKNQEIQDLLKDKQYTLSFKNKRAALLGIIKNQLYGAVQNRFIKNLFNKEHIDIEAISALEEVPYIPVQMFKLFDLATCPESDIVRIVKSSGTTTNVPSKVPLNKETVMRQIKALTVTLANYLGADKKTFLVIDHEKIVSSGQDMSARGAGVRGLSIYASEIHYLLKEEDGKLVLNRPVIDKICNEYKNTDVYIFGFTYIMWSVFYKQIKDENIEFTFKSVTIFHSGGWKKLEDEKVSKETFTQKTASLFNTDEKHIHDFYGMAEQLGVIFVDCEKGNKHVPDFASVIIRDMQTLKPSAIGEVGFIEVLSILANSYYSQAILTEDRGFLVGVDDCPCGRKGEYFRFTSRIPKAELRGCGDTFQEQ